MSKFQYYPNYDDPEFMKKITNKKEFYINKISKERKTEKEICAKTKKFQLLPQQSFLKNFINMDTPYQNILVFHGTGVGKTEASIGIAENFSEMLEKYDSNVYVLVSGNETKVNYRNRLLTNITGEKYITNEERQQLKEYEILDTPASREEIKKINRRIDTRIKRIGHYRIVGYETFVHRVIGRTVKDRKTGKDKKDTDGNVIREIVGTPIINLDNCILIIDEAHRVVNENDFGIAIRTILSKSNNFRMVLLTATPLFHGPDKIVELVNLLNLPKNEVIGIDDIFEDFNPTENKYRLHKNSLDIIRKYVSGKVSYSRGKDPISFPNRIDIGEIPKPIGIPKNELMKHTPVVRCEMSDFHYKTYQKYFDGTKGKNNIYLSNMVLPNPNDPKTGIYLSDDLKKLVNAPKKWLNDNKIQILEEKDGNLIITGEFLKKEILKKYSTKYYNLLKNIEQAVNDKSGLVFIYIEDIVGVGLNMIKQILIQNGYLEYISDTQKNTSPDTLDAITGLTRSKYKGDNFKPARFITIYGESDMKYRSRLIERFKSQDNENGEYIKICLGSRVAREAIDFKNIRQIHIMNAQYEYGSIEQIVGRGIRTCSHVGKTGEKRNVYVYKYVASLPSKSGKYEESIEERIYREEEKVDIITKQIERVLKENAVDCVLNKSGNVFIEEIEKYKGCEKHDKCPALCEYQSCNYKCTFDQLPKDKQGFYDDIPPNKLNKDTYTITMAQREIELIKNIIEVCFRKNVVYTIETLLDEIYYDQKNKYLDEKYIFLALTQMIDNKETIYDRFDIEGYIIYRGVHYIFQPKDRSELISVEERIVPNYDTFKKIRKVSKYIKDKIGKETIEDTKKTISINPEEAVKIIIKDMYNLKDKYDISKLLGRQKTIVQETLLEKIIEDSITIKPTINTVIKNSVYNNYKPYLIYVKDILNYSSGNFYKLDHKTVIGYSLTKSKVFINDKWRDANKYLTDDSKLLLISNRKYPKENNIIVGYMGETKDYSILKLRPPVIESKEGFVDRRKIPSGFVCRQSSNKKYVMDIAKKLGVRIRDTDTIPDICDAIETQLRFNQINNKENKMWLYEVYE